MANKPAVVQTYIPDMPNRLHTVVGKFVEVSTDAFTGVVYRISHFLYYSNEKGVRTIDMGTVSAAKKMMATYSA